MGKKIELKKIEDCKRSQVTFSKRRSSLIKKMQETSIHCDVDVAFMAFSSSGRISKFSNRQRIEDVLEHYASLPIEKRLSHIDNIQEKIKRLQELGNINSEEGYFSLLNDQIENLQLRVKEYEIEVERTEAALREFEIKPEEEATLEQLSRCEANLKKAIEKAKEIKREKLAMEKEKGMRRLAKEDVNYSNLVNAGCGSSSGQLQSWRKNEYIFPKNVFDEMLGNDKGKAKVITASVASDQMKALQLGKDNGKEKVIPASAAFDQMTALQVAKSNSLWIGDFNSQKDNLVTRDLLSAFTEKSMEVRKTPSDDDDDADDTNASDYLKEMSVTKNGSNPSDVNIGVDNNININEDSEVMILSPPPSATNFFSLE